MKPKIGIFCGSASPSRSIYTDDAAKLGTFLALAQFPVLYGGANKGLMGHMARNLLEAGGEIYGASTKQELSLAIDPLPLTDLTLMDSIAARKELILEEAAAFIILPGGWGTFDELAELLVAKQTGLHPKPLILLNTAGYWDLFLELMMHMHQEEFLTEEETRLFHLAVTPREAVTYLSTQL